VAGREAELDHLMRTGPGSRAGRSSCTLVIGEGGVGKSRLLAGTATAARQLRA
jgi:predicted ATPase